MKKLDFTLFPKALRTHSLRLLGLKTILYKAFWAILSLRVMSGVAVSVCRLSPLGGLILARRVVGFEFRV